MPSQQTYLSPDITQRIAAFDIGSNSIRLVVAETLRGARYRILDEERESTRLGSGLAIDGMMESKSIEASLACLRRFKQIADGYKVQTIRTIATCAVREAKNGEEFCRRVLEETGLAIEVISSVKEAHLAFHSVRRRFHLTGKNTILADVGGGSTEIVLASGQVIEAVFPTKLGAVRLTQKFGGGQGMVGADYDNMVRWIDRSLRKNTRKISPPPHFLIGSGGTFTTLASMMMAQKNRQGVPVRGFPVSRAELRHLLDSLRKLSPKERRRIPGLQEDRADIIVAGLAIIDRIMKWSGVNLLQVHNRGVRDGLILRTIEETLVAESPKEIDRNSLVTQFARVCGTDLKHDQQVATLAVGLFRQLQEPFGLNPQDQFILELAARLQDVGYLIDYDKHHKHTYHLILNSQLEGIPSGDLELIANVARYHRGSEPKKKHPNFARLEEQEQKRVLQLSAILRLACGLDRSHSQTVEKVDVEAKPEGVELAVHSATFPEVDLWGVRRRAGLFEKVFDSPLTVEWASAAKTA